MKVGPVAGSGSGIRTCSVGRRQVDGRSGAAVVAVAVLWLIPAAGCKSARAKAPPIAAAPSPKNAPGGMPAATEPVSVPQTTARLPPPQPIPPEAVPQESPAPAGEPASPPAPRPKVAERTRPAPATVPTPARESAGPGPQLRPQLTAEQERDLRRQIDQLLATAEQSLAQARIQKSDKERSAAAERVRAFMDQAKQARRVGDLVRARSLAERAQLLASDLAQASR